MSGIRWIKFKDGTKLAVFKRDAVKGVVQDTLYQDGVINGVITTGDSQGFVNANELSGKRLEDENGNIWVFAVRSQSVMDVSVTTPQGIVHSAALNKSYSSTSHWIHFLTYTEDGAGNYNIYTAQVRPSTERGSTTTSGKRYLYGSYVNGLAGNNYFDVDLALGSEYPCLWLSDKYTDASGFMSIRNAFKWAFDIGTTNEIGYYFRTSSGSYSSTPLITLTEDSISVDPPSPPPEDTDPYSEIDGESDIPGGGSVAIPGFPPATATATGIIGLFAPSESQMQQLADFMWTDFGGQGTTVVDVLKELVEAIKRSISNPLDYVIGLNIIPSQGLTIGETQTVKFGFVSSGVSMPRLANQYFEVDCGSLSFDALCGDTFLDYAPYSKFSIYLPYIGFKDVDANDFVGHTIGVKYHGDTVTGGVTAYITKDDSVMYQYSGCCALNIPLSSDNWGSTIAATVQIATSMVAGGVAGGAAGVGKAAINGAANVAANPSLLSPQVQHSGAVSGGAGAMGVQFPFVVREAVRFHPTTSFNKISGYPSFYYRQLSTVTGFTTVLDVHLDGIAATRGEVMEIENLLKSGVIL